MVNTQKHRQHYHRLVYRFFSADELSIRFLHTKTTEPCFPEIFFPQSFSCTIIEGRSMGILTFHKWLLRAMPRSCGIIDVQHFTLITGISGMLSYRVQ